MADRLTDKQREAIKKAFTQYDSDGSGNITAEELEDAMGAVGQPPSKEHLQDLMHILDKNADGLIILHEFTDMMKSQMGISADGSSLRTYFRRFDMSGDGYIDEGELMVVLRSFGGEPSLQEAKQLLKDTDRDGDGKINYSEFVAMMADDEPSETGVKV